MRFHKISMMNRGDTQNKVPALFRSGEDAFSLARIFLENKKRAFAVGRGSGSTSSSQRRREMQTKEEKEELQHSFTRIIRQGLQIRLSSCEFIKFVLISLEGSACHAWVLHSRIFILHLGTARYWA